MTRRHLVIVGCAALVLLTPVMTVSLSAQGKWWTSEKYKQRLGLTAEQSQQCEQIFQAMAPKLRAAKAELDRQEGRFSELLKRSDSTEAQITPAIDSLEAARSDLGKLRSLMLYRMRTVLTPEQRAMLEADHQRNERPHSGSGTRPEKDSGRPGSR
jgi:Spy/CpxP family protein refolding chaperone